MLQCYRLAYPAATHDHARLSIVNEEADVVEDEVVVKGFADVAEFDEVARRGRLCMLWDSRAHADLLLLMSLPAEANQIRGWVE
jgi:hypothetical protein